MSEIQDILALHGEALKADKRVAVATVIKTEGPSYRSAGARSLIVEDGTFSGGLSAGCLEGDIACRLDSISNEAFVVTYDLSEEDDIRGFPFGCGGTVMIFVEPLPNQRALNAMRWLSELDEPAVMLTVVKTDHAGDAKTAPGARFGISKSGSANLCDGLANMLPLCKMIFDAQKCQLINVTLNGENLEIFAEYFEPAISVVIFGDGEDARILEDIARRVGMHALRLSKQVVRSCNSLLQEYQNLTRSYLVVMTHDLNLDTRVLEQLITSAPPYLGIMGPRSRTQKILTAIGVRPSSIFSQPHFYSPVGLNMAAETPSEIALSVLAEIQTVARKTNPQHLRDKDGAIHERWELEPKH
ncbi:MAG TPA: XdhC family protein [Drouetiella sp.]|jgi:xanthine dehydrogenase accessory factor